MYYEVRGEGPHLMFISGTGGDLRRKPNVFNHLIAEHFEIVAFDQRGLGQTDKPDVSYVMNDYAADVDALLEVLKWNSCLVMGVSFGGMVAQEFALRYPQRVEKMVLACTSSGGEGGSSFPLHELLLGTSLRERAVRMIELLDTRYDKAWQTAHPRQFKVMIDQRVKRYRLAESEPGRAVGARRQLEARMHHDTYERLPNLQMPVFICGGKHDGISPPENLRALCGQIPNAQLEFFDGGHGFLLQDPKAYQHIIDFFIQE
jgi:3-oxoadipate enol-lactonase